MAITGVKNINDHVKRMLNLVAEKTNELTRQNKNLQKSAKDGQSTMSARDLIESWCDDLILELRDFCK